MRLLPLLLVLLLPGVAGAHNDRPGVEEIKMAYPVATEEEQKRAGYKPGSRPGIPFELWEEIEKSDSVDRFLSEQVQPEIEAGDKWFKSIESYTKNKDEVDTRIQLSISHYLKAIALMMEEKLRRESR